MCFFTLATQYKQIIFFPKITEKLSVLKKWNMKNSLLEENLKYLKKVKYFEFQLVSGHNQVYPAQSKNKTCGEKSVSNINRYFEEKSTSGIDRY